MATRDDDYDTEDAFLDDIDELDVLDFTSTASTEPRKKDITTPVDLGGETLTFHRPKDGTLFFTQSAIADTANDADRWLAGLRFLEATLKPQDRKRFLDRACDRDDNLTAGMFWETIGQLLRRWDPASKVPPGTVLRIDPVPDGVQGQRPVRIVDDNLALDFVAHPPKDIILGITASAIGAGASTGQQAWCITLFLDGALDPAVALELSYRLNSPAYSNDPLELGHLFEIIRKLIERWYSGEVPRPNRAARRAQTAAARKQTKAAPPPASDDDAEDAPVAPATTTKAAAKKKPMVTTAKVKPAAKKSASARTSATRRRRTITASVEDEE